MLEIETGKQQFEQIYFYGFRLGLSPAQTARSNNKVWDQERVNALRDVGFKNLVALNSTLKMMDGILVYPYAMDNDELKTLV
uniref:DUF4332 domain-containing protein n=1 Tax=Angiostrongylus cantonensis TaxID=6313 RepID=A0A0K0D384_ANGCA